MEQPTIIRQEHRPQERVSHRLWPLPSALRALHNRAFVLLWGGQLCSRFGDALFQVTLTWWVLAHNGSAAAIANLLTAALLPTLLGLLVGGVVVDRISRIRVMQVSDLLRGVIVGLAAVLVWTEQLQLWHLYGLNVVFGAVDAFFQPAFAAAVPEFVADEDLPSANGLLSIGTHVGRIAGPALGAVLLVVGDAAPTFTVIALLFLCAAGLLIPLDPCRQIVTTAAPSSEGALGSVRAGFETVCTTPWLWRAILVFAISNITLGGPYGIALPVLVHDNYQGQAAVLGLLYSCFASGYLAGGLWMARFSRLLNHSRLIYGGLALAGMTLCVLSLPLPLMILALIALCNGAALELAGLAWTNALQEHVPREQLGRVASIDALGSFALIPAGYGFAAWATDLLGAAALLSLGGGMTVLVAGGMLINQASVRKVEPPRKGLV